MITDDPVATQAIVETMIHARKSRLGWVRVVAVIIITPAIAVVVIGIILAALGTKPSPAATVWVRNGALGPLA